MSKDYGVERWRDSGRLTLQPTAAVDIPFVLAAERGAHAREYVTSWSEEEHAHAILEDDQEHLLVRLDEESAGFVLLAGLVSSPDSIELRRIVVMKTGVGLGREAHRARARAGIRQNSGPPGVARRQGR